MGEESTSNDNNANNDNNGSSYESPVILNVYDLTPANQYTVWFGFGIFHSGIEGKKILILIFLEISIYGFS